MSQIQPIIQIKNLDKEFLTGGDFIKVLDQINLDIMPGEIFGIIGLSGAGKSTLVRCINYLERPTRGEILFDGTSLSGLNEAGLCRVRKSMGMIFQQFNLLMQRTALDNVCFPLELAGISKKDARERAAKLLSMVGLSDKRGAWPAQLSGGQKQRVAIARALANDPKVLLCDEATSALDPATTGSILELLKEINETMGITIIMITHEMDVVKKICHRVAAIDEDHRITTIKEAGDYDGII